MAHVNQGTRDLFLNRSDIENYLYDQISANAQEKIGTEIEFFFISPRNTPITIEDGQKAFGYFDAYFRAQGYKTSSQHEMHEGTDYVTSLAVADLGNIDLETGHGFEFASDICGSVDDVWLRNCIFFDALKPIESKIGYKSLFKGYTTAYDMQVPIKRERSQHVRDSYHERFGHAAEEVLRIQSATASTQINIDCCQNYFHEVFRALLLLEPALSFHYTDNSLRSHFRRHAYLKIVPAQVEPLSDIWESRDNKSAIAVVVDRLLTIQVPFLPDLIGNYCKLPLDPITRQPPTVQQLMEEGKLCEHALKNILPLFHTRPALRRPAVLEVRGPDSLDSPDKIADLAARVSETCYIPTKRRTLLNYFDWLTTDDIKILHNASADFDRSQARNLPLSSKTVGAVIDDIMTLTQPGYLHPNANQPGILSFG